jgi:hypothetical protein
MFRVTDIVTVTHEGKDNHTDTHQDLGQTLKFLNFYLLCALSATHSKGAVEISGGDRDATSCTNVVIN